MAASHRFIVSEYWHSADAEGTRTDTNNIVERVAINMRNPFGTSSDRYTQTQFFYETLYPKHYRSPQFGLLLNTPLNSAAPEASFRLQRVGATGGLGRITYPILDDNHFTDRPRRRHVDAAHWQSLLNANAWADRFQFTQTSRVMTQVLFHKADLTFEPVTSYIMQPCVCRIWNRWREYDHAHRYAHDILWKPPGL